MSNINEISLPNKDETKRLSAKHNSSMSLLDSENSRMQNKPLESETSEDVYEDQDKILSRGITIPKIGYANINEDELRRQYARSTLELRNNVKRGTHPLFGYPLVCYSPTGEDDLK